MVLCLGEPPGGFYDVGCCSSFITVFVMLVVVVFTFPGYFSMPSGLHPGFSDPWRLPPALSYTLASFDCLTFQSHFYRERYGFEWAFFTHMRFLPCSPSPHSWHNLLLPRPPWEPAVLPWSLQGFIAGLQADPRNTGPAHLFIWFTAIHNLDNQKTSCLLVSNITTNYLR